MAGSYEPDARLEREFPRLTKSEAIVKPAFLIIARLDEDTHGKMRMGKWMKLLGVGRSSVQALGFELV